MGNSPWDPAILAQADGATSGQDIDCTPYFFRLLSPSLKRELRFLLLFS